MDNINSRTEILIGCDGIEKLKNKRVAIFGIGGVGGYVCEALVRSGILNFDLIDFDTVEASNINRQLVATNSTIGMKKTEVMKKRMSEINPDVSVNIYDMFFLPETANKIPFDKFDYIVDAIDTVTGKIELVVMTDKMNIPIISAMGAGNKLDPDAFHISDIYDTCVCPLAKVMRRELKERGIKKLKCVYSDEPPVSNSRPPGSISYAPGIMGLMIAGEVIRDISGK